ncbi:hypothetical protein [Gryllotalpicola sp.]|uniref:hypothetical protein n=1 Tax=Gryllotalpicola sp. TaxID=1932787 RepID=UPI002627ACC4|nr:hypothetical protein [Gryllotalpicola sp.]
MMKRRYFAIAAGAAVAVFAAFGAAGASALWSAKDTVAVTANAGTTGLTLTGFDALTATYQYPSPLTSVANVTLTNSGTLPLTGFSSTTTVPTSGDAATLAGELAVSIWANPSNATCPTTAPSGTTAYTGTWAAMPSWLSGQDTLAVGASAHYCIATSISSTNAQSVSNTTLTPQVTITASKSAWTTGAIATSGYTLSAVSAATVTETEASISAPDSSTTTVTGIAINQGASPTSTSAIDSGNGTLTTPYYFCPVITVSVPNDGQAHSWSIAIDTTKPPYNGLTLTAAMLESNGAYTAKIQSVVNGVYTLVGAETVGTNGTTLNAVDWANHPGSVANTPLTYPQSTNVIFCENQNLNPGVYPAGSGTYSIDAVNIQSCANQANPALTLSDACLYASVSGLYPHFYIGWELDIDWTALVNASSLNASDKATLLGRSSIRFGTLTATGPGTQSTGFGSPAMTIIHCTDNTAPGCTDTQASNSDTWFVLATNSSGQYGFSAATGGITGGQTNTWKTSLAH